MLKSVEKGVVFHFPGQHVLERLTHIHMKESSEKLHLIQMENHFG